VRYRSRSYADAIRARSPIDATAGRTPRPSGSRFAPPKVVVTACSCRRRNNLQLTELGGELEHRAVVEAGFGHGDVSPVRAGRVHLAKGVVEAPEIVSSGRGHDVDATRDFFGALQDARERADNDVADAVPVERQ
jgi:hypothetical protein